MAENLFPYILYATRPVNSIWSNTGSRAQYISHVKLSHRSPDFGQLSLIQYISGFAGFIKSTAWVLQKAGARSMQLEHDAAVGIECWTFNFGSNWPSIILGKSWLESIRPEFCVMSFFFFG